MQYQFGKQLYQNCFNRLQETLDQVRRQGEEEVRNLKVHLEELEEDRKDLENKFRRFEIGGWGRWGAYICNTFTVSGHKFLQM